LSNQNFNFDLKNSKLIKKICTKLLEMQVKVFLIA